MTREEKKLRKALKLYGLEDKEIEVIVSNVEHASDEDEEPAAVEEPKVESVGETEEAKEEPIVNEEPKIDEESDKAEDGEKADEVSPSEEPPVEEKAEEKAEEVEGEKPEEQPMEAPKVEPMEEKPAEPEAPIPPADEPKANNYDEAFKLLQSKNEELEKANAGYEARLARLEEIVSALGQKEVIPEANAFGDAQRESPTGKDYVDVRSEYIKKLGGSV